MNGVRPCYVDFRSHPESTGPKLAYHLAMAITLDNLAEMWEADVAIRQKARQGLALIQWPNPQAVGIPSMTLVLSVMFPIPVPLKHVMLRKAVLMNVKILKETAHVWVDTFDYEECGTPRTPPLRSLRLEVWFCEAFLVCFAFCWFQASFHVASFFVWQVERFWRIMEIGGMDAGGRPSKVIMHADAWGIRKLTSYVLRSLRLQRVAREPRLHLRSHAPLVWNSQEDEINELLEIYRAAWNLPEPEHRQIKELRAVYNLHAYRHTVYRFKCSFV